MSPLHSVRIRDHPGGSLSDAERARCAREAADLIYSAGATVLGGTMVKCGWRRGRWVLCAAVLAAWACDDGSKGGAGADEDAGSADALPETDLDAAVDAGPPPMCGDEPACVDAVCVDVGDGPVCRAPCGADDACPEGETCREVADGLGATVRVCLPEDADPCGDVDTTRDVDHCGVCGWVCRFVGAAARCVDGICELGPCDEGAVDVDGDPATGCECTPLPSGDEACDEADNDCDGVVDEGFDLGRDIEHCGACGRSCAFGNLQAACDKGECAYGDCLQGWVDLDGAAENGCECPLAEAGEVCNGADDDCDEQTDEGVLNACGQCGDVPEEVCNGLDDDCDGETDEGLLNVCGACGPVPMEACDAADNDCDG
ncbi:MAG: MopE-related protein, partial [Planctomycetota bacterium]